MADVVSLRCILKQRKCRHPKMAAPGKRYSSRSCERRGWRVRRWGRFVRRLQKLRGFAEELDRLQEKGEEIGVNGTFQDALSFMSISQ